MSEKWRWLVCVGVYALIGAYGEEVVNWLSVQYAGTAIYQAVAPVIGAVVLAGLGALVAGLVVAAIWFLVTFVALVISMSRSRDPWTG